MQSLRTWNESYFSDKLSTGSRIEDEFPIFVSYSFAQIKTGGNYFTIDTTGITREPNAVRRDCDVFTTWLEFTLFLPDEFTILIGYTFIQIYHRSITRFIRSLTIAKQNNADQTNVADRLIETTGYGWGNEAIPNVSTYLPRAVLCVITRIV